MIIVQFPPDYDDELHVETKRIEVPENNVYRTTLCTYTFTVAMLPGESNARALERTAASIISGRILDDSPAYPPVDSPAWRWSDFKTLKRRIKLLEHKLADKSPCKLTDADREMLRATVARAQAEGRISYNADADADTAEHGDA